MHSTCTKPWPAAFLVTPHLTIIIETHNFGGFTVLSLTIKHPEPSLDYFLAKFTE